MVLSLSFNPTIVRFKHGRPHKRKGSFFLSGILHSSNEMAINISLVSNSFNPTIVRFKRSYDIPPRLRDFQSYNSSFKRDSSQLDGWYFTFQSYNSSIQTCHVNYERLSMQAFNPVDSNDVKFPILNFQSYNSSIQTIKVKDYFAEGFTFQSYNIRFKLCRISLRAWNTRTFNPTIVRFKPIVIMGIFLRTFNPTIVRSNLCIIKVSVK